MKNPDKIRSQIEQLQADLKAAEKAEKEKVRKRVTRAASRTGLLDLGLSSEQLEKEFSTIARKHGGGKTEKTEPKKPASSADFSGMSAPTSSQSSEVNHG